MIEGSTRCGSFLGAKTMTPVCDGGGGVPARIGGAPPSPFSSALLMLVVVVTGGGRGRLILLGGCCPPTLALLLPVDADDEGLFGLITAALLLFIFKNCCVFDRFVFIACQSFLCRLCLSDLKRAWYLREVCGDGMAGKWGEG